MTDQEMFRSDCLANGASATISNTSGTQCPCMIWRDSENPAYSAEYHRLYPAAEDCGGAGLINRSVTTTNIKAFFTPLNTTISRLFQTKSLQEIIGEHQDADLAMVGAVNTANGQFVDISGLVEREDKITYNAVEYVVRHFYDLSNSERVGQVALLKRKS